MTTFFHVFGDLIPNILILVSTLKVFLQKGIYPTAYFYVAFVISCVINMLLKIIIKQKRPVPYRGTYGMPSGHSQACTFIITLCYLMTSDVRLLYVSVFLAILCFYHRYVFLYHTIPQVIVGALLGVVLGVLAYNIFLSNILNTISHGR